MNTNLGTEYQKKSPLRFNLILVSGREESTLVSELSLLSSFLVVCRYRTLYFGFICLFTGICFLTSQDTVGGLVRRGWTKESQRWTECKTLEGLLGAREFNGFQLRTLVETLVFWNSLSLNTFLTSLFHVKTFLSYPWHGVLIFCVLVWIMARLTLFVAESHKEFTFWGSVGKTGKRRSQSGRESFLL